MTLPTIHASDEPEPVWVLNMAQMGSDTFMVRNDRGEVSLLDRVTLDQLLDQFLRGKQ